jgi:hypothetical protein
MLQKKPIFIFILLLFASALPAIIGFVLTDNRLFYNGVVFNPVDGYSYLAKLEIGKSGDWLFRLPFTAEAGEGRLLYPFYIAAGHILNGIGISLPVGFNLLRLISYGCLVFCLFKLAILLFPDNRNTPGINIFLMAAGSGLGWILLPFGKFGADFWVSEAYPFLAGLANPHFPLALALMVLSILMVNNQNMGVRFVCTGFCALLLSVLSPFGFVLMSGILFMGWMWERKDGLPASLISVLIFIAAGLPYSIYQYWAVGSTPQLAAWTAQNQTPSPAIWDVVLSFSPWLLLIIAGWRALYNQRENPFVRRLILWVILGLILTVIPFNLQRRFMIGLSIPITSLGLLVLPDICERIRVSYRKLLTFCTAIAIPTTILLLIMVILPISTRTPFYYSEQDEQTAIQWLSQQGQGNSVVLLSDQSGLFIPAFSRLRVLYGHPFETIDAENQKQGVIDFFTGKQNRVEETDYLTKSKVEWIFFGSRERKLGTPVIIKNITPTKQFGDVQLFHVAEIMN